MDQRWENLAFLHWRVPSEAVAPLLPAGCRPDEFDGSSWVGLIGFEMVDAGLGYGCPVPYFGTFDEINVRLYSIDADGRRGGDRDQSRTNSVSLGFDNRRSAR